MTLTIDSQAIQKRFGIVENHLAPFGADVSVATLGETDLQRVHSEICRVAEIWRTTSQSGEGHAPPDPYRDWNFLHGEDTTMHNFKLTSILQSQHADKTCMGYFDKGRDRLVFSSKPPRGNELSSGGRIWTGPTSQGIHRVELDLKGPDATNRVWRGYRSVRDERLGRGPWGRQ